MTRSVTKKHDRKNIILRENHEFVEILPRGITHKRGAEYLIMAKERPVLASAAYHQRQKHTISKFHHGHKKLHKITVLKSISVQNYFIRFGITLSQSTILRIKKKRIL